MSATVLVWVGTGSALGAVTRYLISLWWLVQWSQSDSLFPWPTLIANLLGSVLIVLVHVMSEPGGRLRLSVQARAGLLGGFCGGLTTMSVFSLETLLLIESGHAWLALIYVLCALSLWPLAGAIGYAGATYLQSAPRRS